MQKAQRSLPVGLIRRVLVFYIEQDRIEHINTILKHSRQSFFPPVKRDRSTTNSALQILTEKWLKLRRVNELIDLAQSSYNKNRYQSGFVHRLVDFFIAWRDDVRLKRFNEWLLRNAPAESDGEDIKYSMLLNMHIGAHAEVSVLFDKMIGEYNIPPTADHCDIVIESHLRTKSLKRALEMFDEMRTNGILPTTKTYAILMKHYASNRSESKVKDLWDQLLRDGLVPDAHVYAQMMLVKFASNKWQEVLNNYEAMQIDGVKMSSECLTYVIRTYGMLRQVEKVMQLVESNLTTAESSQDLDALIAAAVVASEAKRGAELFKVLSMISKSHPPSLSWPQASLLAEKAILKFLPPTHERAAAWKGFVKSSSLNLERSELGLFLDHLAQLKIEKL
jgi:pentatricopeptide repeat protein